MNYIKLHSNKSPRLVNLDNVTRINATEKGFIIHFNNGELANSFDESFEDVRKLIADLLVRNF